MMIQSTNKRTKGFTLVESLVAISILLLVISGTSSAVSTAISSYTYTKSQVTAFYLAQEAIEMVRQTRDNNALNGVSWLTGLSAQPTDFCYFGNKCYKGSQAANYASCGAACPVMTFDTNRGFYGYGSGTGWVNSPYARTITLTQINAHEIQVEVTVSWPRGSFTAKEYLLDWQS